jgi:hypothetical protein
MARTRDEDGMSEADQELQGARALAQSLGLAKLDETGLRALARAQQAAAARRSTLGPVVLDPAEEPAHVYRAG